MWAFSSCGEQGLLFVMVHWFLIMTASLAGEHGDLGTQDSVVTSGGLSSCGGQAFVAP